VNIVLSRAEKCQAYSRRNAYASSLTNARRYKIIKPISHGDPPFAGLSQPRLDSPNVSSFSLFPSLVSFSASLRLSSGMHHLASISRAYRAFVFSRVRVYTGRPLLLVPQYPRKDLWRVHSFIKILFKFRLSRRRDEERWTILWRNERGNVKVPRPALSVSRLEAGSCPSSSSDTSRLCRVSSSFPVGRGPE